VLSAVFGNPSNEGSLPPRARSSRWSSVQRRLSNCSASATFTH